MTRYSVAIKKIAVVRTPSSGKECSDQEGKVSTHDTAGPTYQPCFSLQ